ncbi:MAG: hypothetical protein ACWGO1_12390 [Anaerolineales bacterium]
MRRRLNNAYLIQLFLLVSLIALLVILAVRGVHPLVFSLIFVAGIFLTALPAFYAGVVLTRREQQRAERVRRSGIPSQGRVLQSGDQVLSEFRRTTMGYKGVDLLLDVPVLLDPGEGTARQVSMKSSVEALPSLKQGILVSVRCDPDDPDYVVLDEDAIV